MSEPESYSYEGAECPYCGCVHGDCFEWLNDEGRDVEFICQDCGKPLVGSVEYSVSYTVVGREPPPPPGPTQSERT